ncbi:hypothetical protein D3C85_1536270 [compost metagenome]
MIATLSASVVPLEPKSCLHDGEVSHEFIDTVRQERPHQEMNDRRVEQAGAERALKLRPMRLVPAQQQPICLIRQP